MYLIRWFFQKLGSCFKRRKLAGRFQDSGIDQIGKDSVDIILESIFIPEFPTCFIKLETIVKGLREKIAATVKDLLIIIQLLVK